MEQISDLPCPSCGATCTLGALRKKREEVRARIAEQARKRYPKPKPPPPSNSLHSHGFGVIGTSNTVMGIGANTIATPQSLILSAGTAMTYNASASEITIQAADSNTLVGAIEINGAVLDVCIECGTVYSPNAKRLGEKILDETYRLDPLGALAEIRDA